MNRDIVAAGVQTRWRAGQSGNPGGKHRSAGITRRIKSILERDCAHAEAVELLEAIDGPGAADRRNAEHLSVGDLIALSLVSLALNRRRRIPAAVQLQAIKLIIERVDGKVDDETPEEDDATQVRHLMSLDQFRRAVGTVAGELAAPIS